jgi:delta11-fatty-acid desaturase
VIFYLDPCAQYETKVPCRLLDEKDSGEEFEWPEYEQKNVTAPKEDAPISDFARELRDKVKAYFEAEAKRRNVPFLEATKVSSRPARMCVVVLCAGGLLNGCLQATPRRWVELGMLFLLFAATLPAVFRGELWTLVAMPFVYWVFGVNFFHDGSHFAVSRDWRINALATYVGWYFSSPLEWYHQHVIGHHVYANIPNKDPDLYHNATMERHTHTLRWRPMHKHQDRTW